MVTYASTAPPLGSDGVLYATAGLPAVEAELYNQSPAVPAGAPPVPALYDRAVRAHVTFIAGPGATSPSYVVLQTDLGDGNWLDLAWAVWTGTTGSSTFVLAAGNDVDAAYQQTRAAGTAPGSTGRVAGPLGGRLRFVGQTAGTPGSVTVTIMYRFVGLR